MIYDWVNDFGASVDWTTGLMGIPFDTIRYTGLLGDHSEEYFTDCWTPTWRDTTE